MRIGIAIVDDNAIELMRMKAILSHYQQFNLLLAANNGKELMEALAKLEILPEICIVDYHMPIMNGAETTRALSKLYPNMKVYGYTSSTTPEEIEAFLESGAKKVYPKDADSFICEDILSLQ